MAKTQYQTSALDYAENYLERLFQIEDHMDSVLDKRIEAIVEKKINQYITYINNNPKNNYQHEQEK